MWLTMLVNCALVVGADAEGIVAKRDATVPVTFSFLRQSAPAGDRKAAYDANERAYYLHVHDIARFSVQAVSENLDEQPVVLHISGMIDKPEGPLGMRIPLADPTKSQEYTLHHEGYDKQLFRITRKDKVTTIEFLPAGKKLLKPGVMFYYIDFFRG